MRTAFCAVVGNIGIVLQRRSVGVLFFTVMLSMKSDPGERSGDK